MNSQYLFRHTFILAATLLLSQGANAAVSGAEADLLKTTLTPLGGEKAGNKDGSIPAWSGGYTTPLPGFKNGSRISDPFAADNPMYSITAKNMAQYADKLSEGSKAMLNKYPASYRIDVYPTRRTAAAPQWVYDNTFKNAGRAKIVDGPNGSMPDGAYGGVPFPIPKSGVEVVWNHLLRWRGDAFRFNFHGVLVTADGKQVLTVDAKADQQSPYYLKGGDISSFNGVYYQNRVINLGPPVRAGEGIAGRTLLNSEAEAWVYLTGQRRVRKLPNPCCDTPAPATAGVMSFDDLEVFFGRTDRFDWKLVGKRELIIPYNGNKLLVPGKNADVLGANHLNPDHMRWELHRVWVVEATLRAGQRHQSPKSTYYFDEDT